MSQTVDRQTVFTEFNQIIHKVFDDDTIVLKDSTTAADVERWDSLNHIKIIVACEQKFGVKFRTTEVAKIANVGEFVDVLVKKITAKNPLPVNS